MKKDPNQFFIISATLFVAVIISWTLFFKHAVEKDTVDIHYFPKTIGTWTSSDLPITQDEYAILETKNAFVRLYTNSVTNAQVYLYLVYSQTNRKVAHPPEICYTGSGLTIIEDAHDSITVPYEHLTIPANRLRMSRGNSIQIAYYWFKVGDTFTSNYWKQQILIAFDILLGKTPSSALVRISADVTGKDLNVSISNIKTFTGLIIPKLFTYLP